MSSESSPEGFRFRSQARGRPSGTFESAILPAGMPNRTRNCISDLVYEELSEAIRSLRLPPGASLSEPAVAAWLQVSRAPVREAFTRLADQNLITIVPQVGGQVAPISIAGVEDAVFVRNALEKAAFELRSRSIRSTRPHSKRSSTAIARRLDAATRRTSSSRTRICTNSCSRLRAFPACGRWSAERKSSSTGCGA